MSFCELVSASAVLILLLRAFKKIVIFKILKFVLNATVPFLSARKDFVIFVDSDSVSCPSVCNSLPFFSFFTSPWTFSDPVFLRGFSLIRLVYMTEMYVAVFKSSDASFPAVLLLPLVPPSCSHFLFFFDAFLFIYL